MGKVAMPSSPMMTIVMMMMTREGGEDDDGDGDTPRCMIKAHASRYSRIVAYALRYWSRTRSLHFDLFLICLLVCLFYNCDPPHSMRNCLTFLLYSLLSVVFEFLGQIRVTVFKMKTTSMLLCTCTWQKSLHRKQRLDILMFNHPTHPHGVTWDRTPEVTWQRQRNDYNLCLSNTGEPTCKHYSHHSFSVPDIPICDPSLLFDRFDRLTHDDLCGGDHFPVILKTFPRDDELSAEHWKFDRADWMSFCSLYMSRLSDEVALSEDPLAQFTEYFNGDCKQNHSQIPRF